MKSTLVLFVICCYTATQQVNSLACKKCDQRLLNIDSCQNGTTEMCNVSISSTEPSVCVKLLTKFKTNQASWVVSYCQLASAYQSQVINRCVSLPPNNFSDPRDTLTTCVCNSTDFCNGARSTRFEAFVLFFPLFFAAKFVR